VGAALVLPTVNVEAMNKHLAEIGKCVSSGAIALLIVDGAGWHSSPKLALPENIVLLKLPPYAPELNPAENIWEYLRGNTLSHQVWETYEEIVDACCNAWNALMRAPDISVQSLPASGRRSKLRAAGISQSTVKAFPLVLQMGYSAGVSLLRRCCASG